MCLPFHSFPLAEKGDITETFLVPLAQASFGGLSFRLLWVRARCLTVGTPAMPETSGFQVPECIADP